MKLTPAYFRRRRLVRKIGLAAIEMERAQMAYDAKPVSEGIFCALIIGFRHGKARDYLKSLLRQALSEEKHD